MGYERTETNYVTMTGKIVSGMRYSHEVMGEAFYMVELAVSRKSACTDYIPLLVSERLLSATTDYRGRVVRVIGQIRSYNLHVDGKSRLILSVIVKDLKFLDMICAARSNCIFLDGYICKEPVYRKTPAGREITDVLLAVRRAYGKSDYIPCVFWGQNARHISNFSVGSHVRMSGRMQSREYMKKQENHVPERRVAYEVSASNFRVDNSGVTC